MLKPFTLFALCTATALAGCGGSSSSSGPLSKSEFIAKGDAVCKRVNDGIHSVGQTNTAADVVREAPKVHALEQQGLSDLRQLKAPADLAGDWATILANIQTLTDNASKIGDAARRNDIAAARAIGKTSTTASSQVTTLAAKLGFKVCSQSN